MVTRPDQQVGMEDIFEDNTITIPENKRMPTNLPGSLLKTPDMPPGRVKRIISKAGL
jgi:hypothetical protein